jgi:hypothetical protein
VVSSVVSTTHSQLLCTSSPSSSETFVFSVEEVMGSLLTRRMEVKELQ